MTRPDIDRLKQFKNAYPVWVYELIEYIEELERELQTAKNDLMEYVL